jgi:hypothetical protein
MYISVSDAATSGWVSIQTTAPKMTSSTSTMVEGVFPCTTDGSKTSTSGIDRMLAAIEMMICTSARKPQVRQNAPFTRRHERAIDAPGPRRSRMKMGTATASRPQNNTPKASAPRPPITPTAMPRPVLTAASRTAINTTTTTGAHGRISARIDTISRPNHRWRTAAMTSRPSARCPITAFPTTPVTTPASTATQSALTTRVAAELPSDVLTECKVLVLVVVLVPLSPLPNDDELNDEEPNAPGTLFSARPMRRRISWAMTESTAAKPKTIRGFFRIVEKLPSSTSPTESGRSGTMPGLYSCW